MVFRLCILQECQILLEENRRLVNRNGSNENMHGQDTLMPTANGSVEEAVLQTQIETLQWQLTQVINGIKLTNTNKQKKMNERKKYDLLVLTTGTRTLFNNNGVLLSVVSLI